MDASAVTNTKNSKVNVILVGGGRIGIVHYNNILKNRRFELRYVVDVIEERARELAEQVGQNCRGLTSIDEALADSSIHAVVICSPTSEHRDSIIKAVNAKKHVMCEKPISLELKELDECYEEAKKNGVHLMCAYQRRYDPNFSKLKSSIVNGDIGQVQYIRSCSRDNPVPTPAYLKISGGIMHDCGSHDIDVLRWIAKEDPVEVHAYASSFIPFIGENDDWDTVVATLKFPSGIIGCIDVSRKAVYGYDQRIEVLGDKGMIQAENERTSTVVLSNEQGSRIDPTRYSFPQRYVITYATELDHFADVVEGKALPLCTHDDARKVAVIADALTESAKHGRPVAPDYTYKN